MKVVFLKMMKMEGKRGDAIVEVIFATKTLTLLDGQKNIEQKYFTSKIEIKLFGNFHLDVLEFVLQFEGTLEVEKYRFQSNSLVKVQQKKGLIIYQRNVKSKKWCEMHHEKKYNGTKEFSRR